jgi:hypothetical protein
VDHAVVVLIAYDHPYPEPLHAVRPIIAPFGIALILTPRQTEKSFASIELEFVSGKAQASPMQDAGLEALRRGVPAGQGLPLLAALASGKSEQISIAYFDENHLNLRVTPC